MTKERNKVLRVLAFIVLFLALAGILAISKTKRVIEVHNEVLETPEARIVSAYTPNRPEETDSSPCISAYNRDICEVIKNGTNVCATNEFPEGTILRLVELNLECVVLDKMAKRYKTEIDLASLDYQKNLEFGRKQVNILIK